MNRLTCDEKTAQINKSNMRLKDDFLLYLKSVKRSPGTIAGYENDLLIVFTYILDNLGNKDFQKITKRDLIGLQNWLLSNGNSSARVRRISLQSAHYQTTVRIFSLTTTRISMDIDPSLERLRIHHSRQSERRLFGRTPNLSTCSMF